MCSLERYTARRGLSVVPESCARRERATVWSGKLLPWGCGCALSAFGLVAHLAAQPSVPLLSLCLPGGGCSLDGGEHTPSCAQGRARQRGVGCSDAFAALANWLSEAAYKLLIALPDAPLVAVAALRWTMPAAQRPHLAGRPPAEASRRTPASWLRSLRRERGQESA